jgi:5-methylcytosine-specific restriction endonuclease McrA
MKEQVKVLLEKGWSRQRIARELKVDPSTITRHARLLGCRDVNPRRSPIDWNAVQEYYDEGHTIDECRDRFGFSYGAWDRAVVRGDVVSRPRSRQQLSRMTRDRVDLLQAEGLKPAEIARTLDISKSTVAFHCRRLGLGADSRFSRRYNWADVQRAIDEEGLSMRRCLTRFGFCRATWYEAVKRGDIVPRPVKIPLEELLVVGRKGTNRTHLKNRLIGEGLKENRCEECGITEWRGRPLVMELHHVNGDGADNRLENLQLLCGNCHAQTDNWGGRGIRRRVGAESRKRSSC